MLFCSSGVIGFWLLNLFLAEENLGEALDDGLFIVGISHCWQNNGRIFGVCFDFMSVFLERVRTRFHLPDVAAGARCPTTFPRYV